VSAKEAFALFKQNPFDPRLRTHKIHHLSALYKKTIYAVRIEDDLRSIFYVDGENIVSLDIGTHAIYRS
jgi:mRNA-degrading endonuclease YafQ of YafQ-DinJ toxin-antitoxin module